MKKIIIPIILGLISFSTKAQQLTGNWQGILSLPGLNLHIVFHVKKEGDKYSSTMDSPDQNATGIAIESTIVTDKNITIESAALGIKYDGVFKTDSNKIVGTFHQGTYNIPLVLIPVLQTGKANIPPGIPHVSLLAVQGDKKKMSILDR